MARKTITILSDKFKGTLSSSEVAAVIKDTLVDAVIDATIDILTMADGGQGTAQALKARPDGQYFVFDHNGKEAVYVPSCGEGLPWEEDLRKGLFRDRTSKAVGTAVAKALTDRPEDTIYIGIGGTLCADIGLGFLEALGFSFERDGKLLRDISYPSLEKSSCYRGRIIGLADVRCPLVGDNLSAISFIPQKGGNATDIALFRKMASSIEKLTGSHVGHHAGAGGGLGYAIESILGCKVFDGASFILNKVLGGGKTDLYITGEGKIDCQTKGGKVVDEVYRKASADGVPAIAFCGQLESPDIYPDVFPCSEYGNPLPSSHEEAVESLRKAVVMAIPTIKHRL